jgi:peptidoglycan hydrolase-like protein with peptidoglycan-binding domain
VIAAQGGGQPGGTAAARTAAVRPAPFELVSVSPVSVSETAGTQAVDGAGTIVVTYNQQIPAGTALPKLSPQTAGSWQRSGDVAIFTPTQPYPADAHVTVTVSGLGNERNRSESSTFKTAAYSTLRLQQILAQLGYLPLTWTPAAGGAPGPAADAQVSAAYNPPAGSFQWEQGYPAQLRSFWSEGQENTIDRGAIIGFEADHGLPTDGTAGNTVWKALLTAAEKAQRNTHGYSYAIASKGSPETLTIWHDGRRVFSSLANTGIPASPTVDGTFPVFEKLPFQIMSGTNPDGSHYADPVEWVSYFNGGDAVHYFSRGSYGWQQSLGCVELPYDAAKRAYPYLPYGTLVTVA